MTDPGARCAELELAKRLRPFVAQRVPASEVDDVLQDVFLRMQRALPGLRDTERVGPWLFAIAQSAIVESHRRRTRHLPLEREPSSEQFEPSGPSALERAVASSLLAFVAALPSAYREALTLSELEGLTQQAAADRLGISLSAMKSRVQRGRAQLRAALEACCRIALDARGRVIECEPRDPNDCRCRAY